MYLQTNSVNHATIFATCAACWLLPSRSCSLCTHTTLNKLFPSVFPRKTSAHSEKPAKPHPNMSQSTSHQVFKTARKQTHATVMHPDKIWLADGFSRGGSFEGVSTPQCDLICVRFFFIWLVQLSFLLSPRWKFSKRKTLVPRNVPSQCVYKVLFYFKFYYEIFPPNAIAHEKFLPGGKKLGGTSPLTLRSKRKGIPFSHVWKNKAKKQINYT